MVCCGIVLCTCCVSENDENMPRDSSMQREAEELAPCWPQLNVTGPYRGGSRSTGCVED